MATASSVNRSRSTCRPFRRRPPQDPLHLTFVLDRTLIPERITDAMEVLVFRDGVLVQPCEPGADPPATPDPCVLNAYYAGDYDDLTIEVLTSGASEWTFGIAPEGGGPPEPQPDTVTGEVLPGGMLTTDTESDGVTADDVLETTVTTSPEGDAGTVTITETTEGVGAGHPDFRILDVFPSIGAPPGSVCRRSWSSS